MSLSRHAYRHVTQSPLLDHVWISDDFLASTFRRFARHHQQRRYESRVPGPMEARRRLAKRRNTALASVVGSEDVAGLFGRNGREHMKWTGADGVRREREGGQSQGSVFNPLGRLEPFPFHEQGVKKSEFEESGWPGNITDGEDRGKLLEEYLRKHWRVTAIKDVVRFLDIDLRQEPAYSRLIFDYLLSHSVRTKQALKELVVFLDDPFLNTQGAGNYLAAMKHFVVHDSGSEQKQAVFKTLTRALRLGLVPSDELCDIIKTVPDIKSRKGACRESNYLACYREIWDAIGRCDVLSHNDLSKETVDAWLGILEKTDSAMFLAKDIILGTQNTGSDRVPGFIMRWLKHATIDNASLDYVRQLLNHFNPDIASWYVIHVTEALALSRTKDRRLLLDRWRKCLSSLQDVSALVSLDSWVDLLPLHTTTPGFGFDKLSKHHQIILRLWALRALNTCLPEPLWRRDLMATDIPIIKLFTLLKADMGDEFIPILQKTIVDLDIPIKSLLLLALDLEKRKAIKKTTRRTLQQLESSSISLQDVFADLHAYNLTKPHLFSTFENMIRKIDITDPNFIEQSIHLAKTGDSKSVWTLLRLLRSHTPLKIALSNSWPRTPNPNPDAKALVLYSPEPRTAENPDPQIALQLIHLLAIAFSVSKQLSPSRAFHRIRWLYVFLMKHNAPVKPSLVRAMYEAGVVRYRREGKRVSPVQYAYIWERVQRFETREMAEALMSPPRIGRR